MILYTIISTGAIDHKSISKPFDTSTFNLLLFKPTYVVKCGKQWMIIICNLLNQTARYTNEPRLSNTITHGDNVEIGTQQFSCDSCRKPDTLLRKQTLSQFLPLLRLNPSCPPEKSISSWLHYSLQCNFLTKT